MNFTNILNTIQIIKLEEDNINNFHKTIMIISLKKIFKKNTNYMIK